MADGEQTQALGEEDTQEDAGDQGGQADEQGLQKEEEGDPGRGEAQQEIGAQLPLASLHEEGVGVEDEAGEHNRDEGGKDVHEDEDALHHVMGAFRQHLHAPLTLQGVEHIEDAHAEGEGEKIDGVVLEAPCDVAQGQLREHRCRHLPACSRPRECG